MSSRGGTSRQNYQRGARWYYTRHYAPMAKYLAKNYLAPMGASYLLGTYKGTSKGSLRGTRSNANAVARKVYKGRFVPSQHYSRQQSINKQIRELRRSVKSDQAYHTHRSYGNANVLSTNAHCNHELIATHNTTNLETAMANLRYYNPSTPGTLTTADASTGTYSRSVHIKNMTISVSVRNNYQVPCNVKLYILTAKSDTNIAPLTYYTNGLSDQFITTEDETSPGAYLTDVDVLKAQYFIKCVKSKLLQPGMEIHHSHSTGSFDYDPSLVDSHNVAFQKKYKAFQYVVRVEGVQAHDTAQAELGIIQAGVDCDFCRKYEFIYDAGVNLNDFYITDGRSQSFTNNPVVSNKPTSGNQTYSKP